MLIFVHICILLLHGTISFCATDGIHTEVSKIVALSEDSANRGDLSISVKSSGHSVSSTRSIIHAETIHISESIDTGQELSDGDLSNPGRSSKQLDTESVKDGAKAEEGKAEAKGNVSGRLSLSIRPYSYNILLHPFINGNRSIHGQVEIEMKVYKATDKIVLNMADIITLNDTCRVTSSSGDDSQNPKVISQSYDPKLQFYTVQLDRPLAAGQKYKFSVSFVGYLNSKLVGFYLSSYVDSAGVEHNVAATQFSPVDARKAFPCFDEPSFKAVFNIALRREGNYTAMSNMPVKETVAVPNLPGWFEDRFHPTPKQSTYIVGFLISDFEGASSPALNHTNFTVWSRPEAISQTDYSLEVGPKVLVFLEDYFGIEYPLPKLDMAAIPDFKFNGMENWGLIMYRESAVLFDPSVSTVDSKRSIAAVVAHELAHMWFGNLVTPHWWSDLWLKEGFATYMGYTALDGVEPQWKMLEYIVTSSAQAALYSDSLQSSHSVQVAVDRVDRISEIFDDISYQKGASIIRMMFHFLTKLTFKKGMTDYLNDLRYSNARQDDLWRSLSKAWEESVFSSREGNMTVKDVMDTWTLKVGYPLITVSRNDTHLSLSQSRFLLEGNLMLQNITEEGDSLEDSATGWWVPVSVTNSSGGFLSTQPSYWLTPDVLEITVPETSSNSVWILVNVQRSGFYRVNYDDENWEMLKIQLYTYHGKIHPLNRAQILDDAWTLARSNILHYSIPLELSLYMKKEEEYTPWETFVEHDYKYLLNMAKGTPHLDNFNKYLLDLIIPLYNKTGFEDRESDTYETQSLRILATNTACRIGHQPCLDSASSLFLKWLSSPPDQRASVVSNNVKPTVLCYGIASGDEESWNMTFNLYLESNVQTEKNDILSALGCTKNPDLLQRYLSMSLDGVSGIIKQDVAAVFGAVTRSIEGRNLAWERVKKEWRFIADHFGYGSSAIWRILRAATKDANTRAKVLEMKEFYKSNMEFLGSARQTMRKSLESAEINAAFMEQLFPSLVELLSSSDSGLASRA